MDLVTHNDSIHPSVILKINIGFVRIICLQLKAYIINNVSQSKLYAKK